MNEGQVYSDGDRDEPDRGPGRVTVDLRTEATAAHTHYRVLTPSIQRRLSAVLATVFSVLTIGIILYREPFKFWQYPLSDLGATLTQDGLPNVVPLVLFDTGMISCAVVMFSISTLFATSDVEHRKLKRLLALICAFGFVVIIFPYNVNDPIHMTGGGAVFGGMWGLFLLLLLELRSRIGGARFWLLQLLLQGTLLPYAVMFAIGPPIQQAYQKPAVIGMLTAFWLTLRFWRNVENPAT